MNAQALADAAGKVLYGQTTGEAVARKMCIACQKAATVFRDDTSAREYAQSGLCQACQDRIFSQGDQDDQDDSD
jgi:hypothetical protein